MKLILLLILSFIFSTHPIMLIIIMILTTITLNMYMYMYMKFSWFILMITLLILGGLLVIFLYITSLTPNKKFIFKKMYFFMIPLTFMLNTKQMTFFSTKNYQMMTLFSPTSLTILMFILIYLMLTLISIMVMIKSSMAPLKSIN
uniref:NADH dehydrogenase subunit 6 n=1 Tax=Alectorobius puertoricensis TaxID=48824 RepID=UPI00223870DA|nr:NADH dehydrogenase subunit 6 [Alectorobius puertoricensis]UYB78545.1 NADH dehydrogenase subunit 6 [Alectorobius puertoricensis]UYB78558.1 NADH dehydrogenase subunit 6 [Alectorobius puertoricensis]